MASAVVASDGAVACPRSLRARGRNILRPAWQHDEEHDYRGHLRTRGPTVADRRGIEGGSDRHGDIDRHNGLDGAERSGTFIASPVESRALRSAFVESAILSAFAITQRATPLLSVPRVARDVSRWLRGEIVSSRKSPSPLTGRIAQACRHHGASTCRVI